MKSNEEKILKLLLKIDANFRSILTQELVEHLIQYSPDEKEVIYFYFIIEICIIERFIKVENVSKF